jgi:hypothetical protein
MEPLHGVQIVFNLSDNSLGNGHFVTSPFNNIQAFEAVDHGTLRRLSRHILSGSLEVLPG